MLCVAIIAYCSTPTIIYLGLLHGAHKSIGIGSVGASRGCDQRFFRWITTPYSESQDSTELYLSYFSFYIIDGRLSQVRLCFGSRSAFRSFRRVLEDTRAGRCSLLSFFPLQYFSLSLRPQDTSGTQHHQAMRASFLSPLLVLAATFVSLGVAHSHSRRFSKHLVRERDSGCSALYYQCGGINFANATCCKLPLDSGTSLCTGIQLIPVVLEIGEPGSTCVVQNPYYSQCAADSSSTASEASGKVLVASSSVRWGELQRIDLL